MTYETIINIFNFLKQMGLVALGALVPTIIGYFGTREREKAIIKIHFQMEASEELIDGIKRYSENLSKLNILLSSILENYNISITAIDKINTLNEEIYYEDDTVDKIINTVDSYINLWVSCCEMFAKIISILESKEVIFNRFVGFKELLISEHNNILNMYTNIVNYYYLNIYEKVINKENIEESQLKVLRDFENKFKNKKEEMFDYLFDLRVAAQNEFFRRLFRYRVPIRENIVGKTPVYKAGFKYNKNNNKR